MKRLVIAVLAGLACLTSRAEDEKRKAALLEAGGGEATEAAVTSGLRWLARHQGENGHWDAVTFDEHCTGKKCTGTGIADFNVGLTALACLAFLGAGIGPDSSQTWVDSVTGEEVSGGKVVKKALGYLVKKQDTNGAIGPPVGEMMYNHALATRALCEALALTGDEEHWKEPADDAVRFLLKAQNQGLGWRYTPRCGNNDTSVTGLAVLALRSAKKAKLKVPKKAFADAMTWIARVTDSNGQVGYDRLGSGEIYVPGKNESWKHHQTMTAIGMLLRVLCERNEDDPNLERGATILSKDLPEWDPSASRAPNDAYYWHFGTQALFQYPGPRSKKWKRWNEALKAALLESQRPTGCREGSWNVEKVDRWAYAGGRVYVTALDVLTLEVYAAPRVFGDKD